MNIILIGFMGSGKTSVGRILANKLSYNTLDTDEYIVNNEGRSINDIFASDGEEYFRQAETNSLITLNNEGLDSYIIASGGGLPMREINAKELHKLGTVIYLRATADTLENRLKGDTKRPLLKGDGLRAKIDSLLMARSETYEQVADEIVDTDGMNIYQIADLIIAKGLTK